MSLYDRSVSRLIKFRKRASVTRVRAKNLSASERAIRTWWREHLESTLSNYIAQSFLASFSRRASSFTLCVRSGMRHVYKHPHRTCHLMWKLRACTRICIYVGIHKRERTHIATYSRRPSSRRKSRREIIMQKMHREDYDLICRARKQFVSLKDEFLVNLWNYRLPRDCVCAECFIIRNKNEVIEKKATSKTYVRILLQDAQMRKMSTYIFMYD